MSLGIVWFFAFVGFCLIVAEVIIPGAILGILGGVCLAIAIVEAFILGGPVFGVVITLIVVFGCTIGFVIWWHWFPKSYVGQKLTLKSTIASPETAPCRIGQSGEAMTPLRPAGAARINGQKIDVITAGDFIEAGEKIEVESVEGVRVVVRKKT